MQNFVLPQSVTNSEHVRRLIQCAQSVLRPAESQRTRSHRLVVNFLWLFGIRNKPEVGPKTQPGESALKLDAQAPTPDARS